MPSVAERQLSVCLFTPCLLTFTDRIVVSQEKTCQKARLGVSLHFILSPPRSLNACMQGYMQNAEVLGEWTRATCILQDTPLKQKYRLLGR